MIEPVPRYPLTRLDQVSPGMLFTLLPLLMAMPLMYWPKVLEGDTQPWVIMGTMLTFATFWRPTKLRHQAAIVPVTLLSLLAVIAYWARDPDPDYLLRYSAILATFTMLWHIAARDPGAIIGKVVRFTIVLWFLVGLYQVIAVRLGLPVEFFGRYVAGRGGVPSLTAESSFYGSISVLHLMYLITEKDRRNLPYMVLAVLNVLLSGSLLSFVLLVIPLFRLRLGYKIAGSLLALIVVVAGLDLVETGFFSRVVEVGFSGLGTDLLTRDASINLRLGHIWFTFVDNLPRELLFQSSASFFLEYNYWAGLSYNFMQNASDYILPSGGELLFRSGAAGLLLMIFVVRTAYLNSGNLYDRWEKVVFVIACFLNPISLLNPFFIFYIHKRYEES